MDQQAPGRSKDLTDLWENMGASTGSLFGKMVGTAAKNGLQAYQQTVVTPLKQLQSMNGQQTQNQNSMNCQQTQNENQQPGLREKTWSQMGSQYGEAFGTSIGMSMDLLIDSIKTVVSPETNQKNNQETNSTNSQTTIGNNSYEI